MLCRKTAEEVVLLFTQGTHTTFLQDYVVPSILTTHLFRELPRPLDAVVAVAPEYVQHALDVLGRL